MRWAHGVLPVTQGAGLRRVRVPPSGGSRGDAFRPRRTRLWRAASVLCPDRDAGGTGSGRFGQSDGKSAVNRLDGLPPEWRNSGRRPHTGLAREVAGGRRPAGASRVGTCLSRVRQLRLLLLPMLLAAVAQLQAPALPADDWRVGEADVRMPLSVECGLCARREETVRAFLDFNALFGWRRVLAAGSCRLLDAATGESVELDVAQDAELRPGSGNPVLRLRWTSKPLARFEGRLWHLYCRTVGPGSDEAWTPLGATYTPTPPGVLLDTGFESADPERPDRPEFMHPGGKDVAGEATERVWADEQAHSGARALRIARTFANGPQRNSNRPFWWSWPPPMPVQPGQVLHLSAWLKAPDLARRAMAQAMLEFRDGDRRRLQAGRLRRIGGRLPHDWVQVSGTTTAPPGANSAVFWFSLHGEGEAYCDDVLVTSAAGAGMRPLDVETGPLEDRAAFAAVADNERPEGKVLACGAAKQAPVLDGALDDPCWAAAGRIDGLEVHAQVPGTSVRTTVLACADREALYFGFECTEPTTAALKAAATERDGRLWEDDSVELFLDTNLDLRTYYQIIVNSRGVVFDQDTGAPGLAGPTWDGPVSASAQVLPDRWSAEVRLELTGLRMAEAEGRVWGANFSRSSFCSGRSLYVWSPVRKNFGEPQHFGRLVLPFDPTADVVTGRPLAERVVFCGAGALGFEATNRRDEPVRARMTAAEETADGTRALGEVSQDLPPGSVTKLLLPATFPEPGETRVRYELIEAGTGRLLYGTSVTHFVPEPLTIEPETLVSYLGEDRLRGGWTLGLAEEALDDVRLAMAVLPEGAEGPIVESEIAPQGTSGMYAIDVGSVAAGRYEARVRLHRGQGTTGEATYRFERLPGPFSPRP